MPIDTVVPELLKWGAPGALLVLAAFSIRSLYNSYVEVQERRIEEARQNLERVLTALNASTVSQQAQIEATRALGELIKAIQR